MGIYSLPNRTDHQLPFPDAFILYCMALDGIETPNIAAQKSLAYSLLAGKNLVLIFAGVN